MNIKLINITSYSHQGKRPYQEDNFVSGDNFLLVSDGVGGSAKGDVASRLVKEHWAKAISENRITLENYLDDIQKVVDSCLEEMNEFAQSFPESMGMGATLALLLQLDDKLFSIHIGDSRIYHFSKEGKIKWRSKDHSLVQELVNAGVITEEEAHNHPQKNRITRALIAKPDHNTQAAITELKDFDEGDTFLVCSDGVLESWEDKVLSAYIKKKEDNSKLIIEIEQLCSENSSDNNTAILADLDIFKENQQELMLDDAMIEDDTNDDENESIIISESSDEDSNDKSSESLRESLEPIPELSEKPDKKNENLQAALSTEQKELQQNETKVEVSDKIDVSKKENKNKKTLFSKLLKYFVLPLCMVLLGISIANWMESKKVVIESETITPNIKPINNQKNQLENGKSGGSVTKPQTNSQNRQNGTNDVDSILTEKSDMTKKNK